MPTYDYFCPTNHQTVEVMHGMEARVGTWGELCERAGLDTGSTPRGVPVEKLLGAGMVLASSRSDTATDPRACAGPTPMGCCGGGCGMT